MRVRLPLYAKILGWFFLNLVVVVTVIVLLFDAQFHFNLDWLFFTGARERMEAVRDLIVGELEATPPDDWAQVLQRYSAAHHVRFALFDDDATPLVGDVTELPAEVRERIVTRPPFNRPRRPGEATPAPDTQRRGGFRGPLRALMRTTSPTQYWLLASARLDNPRIGDPLRVVLVARSSSISAGGLIFDPKPWLALGLGVVVFSLIFWLPLVRGITRTISGMKQATRQIADGRFDVRVKMRRGDELGALAESIDQMAARLDGLVTGQKRFLGDIAHELCSPLARLQLALGILEQRATGEQASYVRSASEKAEQISALVGELLSFSKASFGAAATQLQLVNVRETAEEAIRRESSEGADLRLDVPADLIVTANPDLLLRALANLLRNALQHAGPAGPITLRAAREGDEVVITVADSGPGVPEDELPKIFDAFYRLDTSRTRGTGGTGLGLAIVKTCVESCCGSVTASNRIPHGLEMVIRLRAEQFAVAGR
jgi:two-component system sensor histidine kinase CpxA